MSLNLGNSKNLIIIISGFFISMIGAIINPTYYFNLTDAQYTVFGIAVILQIFGVFMIGYGVRKE